MPVTREFPMKIRIVALAASLFAAPLGAQQDMGAITGVITDKSGAIVPGARVTVTQRETNEIRLTEADDGGRYTLGPLRVGTYDLAVEMTGFKKAVWGGIALHAQDRVRADFQLELGGVAETVT